jgi:hypothetical protein
MAIIIYKCVIFENKKLNQPFLKKKKCKYIKCKKITNFKNLNNKVYNEKTFVKVSTTRSMFFKLTNESKLRPDMYCIFLLATHGKITKE